MTQEPDNREETGRNPDGTFKEGFSGNPGGRPKSPLKDYIRSKFEKMADAEKEEFLKLISPELQFRMAEGNPHQTEEHSGEVKITKPIYGGLSGHNSDQKDIPTQEENKNS